MSATSRATSLIGLMVSGGLLAVLLSGCTHPSPGQPQPPAVTTLTEAPLDDVESIPVPTSVPRSAAVDITRDALRAFGDHTLDADAWFAALAPYLSQAAQQAYVGTDPTLVPVHRLDGPTVLEPWVSDYLATVTQGTDVGAYTVLLSRNDAGNWQVETIIPPAGVGP